MATSDFWRDLAVQFRAIPDFGELRADWHTVGSGARRWELKGPFVKDIFQTIAIGAAFEIADAGVSDLLVAWLEALKDGGYNVQSGGHLTGSIFRLCEASANLCKKLEIHALQTEFKEKHPAVALVPTPIPSEPEPDSTSPPRSEQGQDEEIERREAVRNELDRCEREARIAPSVEPNDHRSRPMLGVPKLKSHLRIAVLACLMQNPDATDKEILEWLQQNNPSVIPPGWRKNDSLAGKTFTKVRRYIARHPMLSTNKSRH